MTSSVIVNDAADDNSKIIKDDHPQSKTLSIEELLDRVIDKVTIKLTLTLVIVSLVALPTPIGT